MSLAQFLLTARAVHYADDLKALLSKGSIVEQKSFLRSFIKRIEVNRSQVVIDYTIPLETKKTEPLTREVLSVAHSGSPSCTMLITPHPQDSSFWYSPRFIWILNLQEL